jgi:hypothetical protein
MSTYQSQNKFFADEQATVFFKSWQLQKPFSSLKFKGLKQFATPLYGCEIQK